ncbi:flavin reductase family protein [Tsukamurella sp. 8F]|uniref:flavin reductase family protein n=1 Tax=unclassified Tsukamurella TaxID=2633480 RepID=UPI0023B8FB53|nr:MULTISPECIES: flavin reductase family protein [unclassified Tsukamurella]MDF0529278.1 flavin reductase family protein [Tsukamurella sp. 8J]MDF0586885.1 flavin reductase family protein [Tsukamurella sp. 8F]
MAENPTPDATAVDPALFREVMGHYPTGVAVVTGRTTDGTLLALVVGTFSSVSLDPPLVSFMPMRSSRTFARLRECESLCINILGGDQEDLVCTIARRSSDKFEGVDWFPSRAGDPVLDASVAWVDTAIDRIVDAGDHWIVLCAVRDLEIINPVSPLIFFQGGYGTFVGTSLLARMDHAMAPVVERVAGLRGAVEAMAREIGCEATVFTTVGPDEMAAVLSVAAPGNDAVTSLARRIPLVPPLGDSVYFDRSAAEQEHWLARLGRAPGDLVERYRARLEFLGMHGYVLAFMPNGSRDGYAGIARATREYDAGNVTPAQERSIRESIMSAGIDYVARELPASGTVDLASIVVPMRDAEGAHTLTLRLSRLPAGADVRVARGWIDRAIEVGASVGPVGDGRWR